MQAEHPLVAEIEVDPVGSSVRSELEIQDRR